MNWQTVEANVAELAARISDKPDCIVGVVRGGVVPARLLAARLGVLEMYCLTVQKEAGKRRVVTEISVDLAGKSVLLVEDMLESGRSLMAAKDYLETAGAVVQTLAMYIQDQAEIVPDYYLSVQEHVPSFPWE